MAKEEKHKRTILIVILCFLLAAAVVLTTFITLNTKNITENTTPSEIDENFDPLTASIEEVISHYQAKINNTEDSVEKVEYYDARLKTIIEKDIEREHTDQVLVDVISIDDIEQSASSALQVCNFANYFGEDALYEKYFLIFEERQAASEPTTEGRG